MITPKYIMYTYLVAFTLLLVYFLLSYFNPDNMWWYDLLEFIFLFLACMCVIIVTVVNY